MQIRRSTGLLVLSLMTALFLAACGGGGDSAAPAPDSSPAITRALSKNPTSNSIELEATVNPKGQSTNVWFEYSEDPNLVANKTTPIINVGAGSLDCTVTQKIPSGSDPPLKANANYYYRVMARSPGGDKQYPATGSQQFSTLNLPAVTTKDIVTKTINSALLEATVNPNGYPTDAWFEWGKFPNFGNVFDNVSRGSGTDNVQIAKNLQPLEPATRYQYRIAARNTNSIEPTTGATKEFTTDGGVPIGSTKSVKDNSVLTTEAILRADVDPSGLPTDAWFEYGTDSTFITKSATDNVPITVGSGTVPIEKKITFNTPGYPTYPLGTLIWYRVMARNIVGPSLPGQPFSFPVPNPLPKADAGPDQSVYTRSATGATVVTLDASGSSTEPSKEITSYAWTQLSGTEVTLDDSASPTPSFTAPQFAYGPSQDLEFGVTVTDNTGLSDTNNMTVTVNWGFFDDFSTDTTATYTVIENPAGNPGEFTYGTQTARVTTGTGNIIFFSHTFAFDAGQTNYVGVFSLDYRPYQKYGSGGDIVVAVGDSVNTYYRVSTRPGDNLIEKWRAGVLIDSSGPFALTINTNTTYPIIITFTGSVTTLEAFGRVVPLGGGENRVPMNYFSVTTQEQNAVYDNIKLEIHP